MTSPMIKRKEKSTTVLSAKNTMEDAYLKIKDTYSAASPLQKEVQSMNIHQQNAVACQLKAVMLSSRESVRSWMVILTIMATEKNVNMTSVRPFLRCISLNRKQWDSCPQLTLYLETALMKRHAEDSVAITQRALKLRLAWFKAVNFVWLLLILRNWRTFLSKNIDLWTMIYESHLIVLNMSRLRQPSAQRIMASWHKLEKKQNAIWSQHRWKYLRQHGLLQKLLLKICKNKFDLTGVHVSIEKKSMKLSRTDASISQESQLLMDPILNAQPGRYHSSQLLQTECINFKGRDSILRCAF